MIKTIALIGGTGKVGKYVAETALAQGYQIRMLVRTPRAEMPGGIHTVVGDARDPDTVLALIRGCDAVINTFGQPVRGTQHYSTVTRHVLASMQQSGLSRYIGVTGGSLTLEGDRKSLMNRLGAALFKGLYPRMIEDKREEWRIWKNSGLDWTLVRLPFVSEGAGTGTVRESVSDMPGYGIRNGDIAHFLVRQLPDRTYVHQTPFISN